MLSFHRGSTSKILTYYKYCKIIELIPGNDSVVRRVLIEYHIQSIQTKQMCIDIGGLVVHPTFSENNG